MAQLALSARPWEELDPRLGELLAAELPAIAEEIIRAIGDRIPEYRRPMSGAFGAAVGTAIEQALGDFLEMAGRAGAGRRIERRPYVDLGRGELRAGRGLDALQAAYRLGARVAWRRLSAAAQAAGVDAAQQALLAESIFAYIDELAGDSVEGYAREREAAAGERRERRHALVRALTDAHATEAEAQAAAAAAGWELPSTLAVVACEHLDPERLAVRAGPGAVAALLDGCCALIVPDPGGPGRAAALDRALRRGPAAIGPSVGWRAASRSFSLARDCLELQRAGTLDATRPLHADRQHAALIMHARPELLAELAARRLAPLAELTPLARRRFEDTLAAWLAHQGSIPAVAAALEIHRQTVRYRLGRLRELFGVALDDPDLRFELELVLRARSARPAPA